MVEIEELEGVGPTIAEKLRAAGYDSVESIAVATPGELMEASEVLEKGKEEHLRGSSLNEKELVSSKPEGSEALAGLHQRTSQSLSIAVPSVSVSNSTARVEVPSLSIL